MSKVKLTENLTEISVSIIGQIENNVQCLTSSPFWGKHLHGNIRSASLQGVMSAMFGVYFGEIFGADGKRTR